MDAENICPMCRAHEESLLHLFVQCSFARNVWMLTSIGWLFSGAVSWMAWLENVFQMATMARAEEILMIL